MSERSNLFQIYAWTRTHYPMIASAAADPTRPPDLMDVFVVI
jgi:hypothetical protein